MTIGTGIAIASACGAFALIVWRVPEIAYALPLLGILVLAAVIMR